MSGAFTACVTVDVTGLSSCCWFSYNDPTSLVLGSNPNILAMVALDTCSGCVVPVIVLAVAKLANPVLAAGKEAMPEPV